MPQLKDPALARMLREILLGTGAGVGESFFSSLCEHLCRALGVRFALVGRLSPDKSEIRVTTFFARGKKGDGFRHPLKGSPCEEVLDGLPCQYEGDLGAMFPECGFLKENGIRWFHGAPLFNSAGEPRGVLAVMDDRDLDGLMESADEAGAVLYIFGARVSAEMERESVADALKDSVELSRAVLNTAVNAILTMGEDGVIISANKAVEKIFGYAEGELIGQKVNILMPAPYSREHDAYVNRYVETGERRIIGIGREVTAKRKDGTIFPCDLSVGEFYLADGRRLFTGIVRDISERKSLEDRLLSIGEEERRQIGGEIHDDLCQRLFGIGCLTKALEQRAGADEAMRRGLAELGKLVTEANVRGREMARGLMPAALEADGLVYALRELAEASEHAFGIECAVEDQLGAPIHDAAAELQLYRIAQEAVGNAVRHGGAKRVSIRLAEAGERLALEVLDDGRGLPSADERTVGTGVLTMRRRARMLGGHCELVNRPGGGAAVLCRLPRPTPAAAPDDPPTPQP
ncbi:MAG: PAS domain S-box protein [Verrucomicrobiales bacterium]